MAEVEQSEIMTVLEVSDYLKLSKKTVLTMAQNNQIPCTKIGNQWRFVKSMIDDWLLSRMQVIPQNDLSRLIESEYDIVPISRLTDTELILTGILPGSKKEVLDRLAERAVEAKLVTDKDELLEKLLAREAMASTALGNGLALPHIRKPDGTLVREPRIIIGLCKKGVDFNALDNGKTFLFFLLLSDSETVHLRLMSKLNTYLRDEDFTRRLISSETPDELYGEIIKKEGERKIQEGNA
ncbi:MAG: PTS sugar transporter subunit IIA [Spirochaetales bacterium]|nr:PTS sugar transporter subunit IIA [Spirochaetales bacterium]MCF7938240.1 PTS sugar transporter subunit IIA [Spirochaetales bacterium]